MMLTQGVYGLPRRIHRRVCALLDRLEIWDTPVTHRSRLGLLALIKDLRDGATHYTLCLRYCVVPSVVRRSGNTPFAESLCAMPRCGVQKAKPS